MTVFGDFHAEGLYSEAAARAIVAHGADAARLRRPCRPGAAGSGGVGPDRDRADGLRGVRAGLRPEGPGPKWPLHRVLDGLDQLEVLLDQGCLLLHPRCVHLKAAFQNYTRRRSAGGDWLDEPPQDHPHEDLMDALRGGVRDRFPEGRIEQPNLRKVHA